MKRTVTTLLLAACLLAGCGAQQGTAGKADETASAPTTGTTQIANPWAGYDTLAEAEAAAGFALDMPETIEPYQAEVFRVMSGQLLEVTYRSGASEVTVRKIAGEGQDVSGVFKDYETVTESERGGGTVTVKTDGTEVLTLVSCGGCSWSLYAPGGYEGDAAESFLFSITKE